MRPPSRSSGSSRRDGNGATTPSTTPSCRSPLAARAWRRRRSSSASNGSGATLSLVVGDRSCGVSGEVAAQLAACPRQQRVRGRDATSRASRRSRRPGCRRRRRASAPHGARRSRPTGARAPSPPTPPASPTRGHRPTPIAACAAASAAVASRRGSGTAPPRAKNPTVALSVWPCAIRSTTVTQLSCVRSHACSRSPPHNRRR